MELSSTIQILTLAILLMFSAFFSSCETALMSLSKMRLRHLTDTGVKNADIVAKLLEDPTNLLGALLVGNNIVNIGASSLATSIALEAFDNNGVAIATGVMTFLVLIFGEITPKSLATKYNEGISLRFSKILYVITKILLPIVFILTKLTNGLVRIFGVDLKGGQPKISEEELKTIVNVSHEEGVLKGEESQMIFNVFDFSNNKVSEVMTPKINIVAIDINSSYKEISEVINEEQFSRIPVYEGNADNIVGILHVKDLVFFNEKEREFNLKEYIRKPFFTYEFNNNGKLFSEMRSNHVSMAIVLDEYGDTEGIVTIEDLVEEIVGEIIDEYDECNNQIDKISENEYSVDGSTKVSDLKDELGIDIEGQEIETIGGYLIELIGRLPEKDEVIECGEVNFIVTNTYKNRIEKLMVVKKSTIVEDEVLVEV